MTDKQIKDGIDVSQCECYSVEDNSCNDTLSGSCMKEKCQTFRLLQTIKAKEQECEAYKMEAGEGKEINAELKAENENLKAKLLELLDKKGITRSEKEILEQCIKTLTEIKEIAEQINITIMGGSDSPKDEWESLYHNTMKAILQKISECEVDNVASD